MSAAILTAESEPYSSVHKIPWTPYYVQDGYVISNLITTNSAAIILDIGSKEGSVSRFIAQQNLSNVVKIYSIDSWLSSDPSLKNQYHEFLSNVEYEQTSDSIISIRMSSKEAAYALNLVGDFIFLGSNVDKLLYEDVYQWIVHLSDNGIIAGLNWYDNSIKSAVSKAASELNLNVVVNDDVWYLVRN